MLLSQVSESKKMQRNDKRNEIDDAISVMQYRACKYEILALFFNSHLFYVIQTI